MGKDRRDGQPVGVEQIKARARQAHADGAVRDGLVRTMLDDAGRASRHAAWALTHLPKEDVRHLAAHRGPMVHLALATADPSLRRLTLALIERMVWGREEVRADLVDFCLSRLADPAEPYGVRSLCMKLAWLQCRHYAELREELRQVLSMVEPSQLGPGVLNTYRKTLGNLS